MALYVAVKFVRAVNRPDEAKLLEIVEHEAEAIGVVGIDVERLSKLEGVDEENFFALDLPKKVCSGRVLNKSKGAHCDGAES